MGFRFDHARTFPWGPIVSTIVALAVWLVASPAFAGELPGGGEEGTGRSAAPQCDIRGATTFGPAPTLDPPKASVDIGDDDAACVELIAIESLHNGAPTDDAPPPRTEAIVPRTPRVPSAAAFDLPLLHDRAGGPRAGVRSSLERPPRVF
jgi:hypothetical protein